MLPVLSVSSWWSLPPPGWELCLRSRLDWSLLLGRYHLRANYLIPTGALIQEETAVCGLCDPTCLLGCLQAAHQECLVLTAPSYASVVLERCATQRLGLVSVRQDTVVHPAKWVSSWTL